MSAARRKLKLVVSDFHLGRGRFFRDGSRNILEDFNHDDAFIAFLNFYSGGEYVDADVELILNGDIFNLLQINYKGVHTYLMTERIVLDGLRQIVQGHGEFFRALKRFVSIPGHSIVYLVGNHDQGMLFERPRQYMREVVGHDIRFFDSHYEFDGIHVEHGHMHEWPTRFDSQRYFVSRGLPEPILNLPWGSLFVAECLPKIKMERPYVDKVKPFSTMLRWMAVNDTLFAFKTLGRLILFALDSLIFKRRYRYSGLKATLNIIKEVTVFPTFDREAAKILEINPEIHAVIMGHTHVLRYRQYREGKEYFNIGTWNEATSLSVENLGTVVSLTFALIEYPELPPDVDVATTHDKTVAKPKIRLKEWKGIWRPEIDAAI
ncbi:MAG: metallophosphoesterase [Deltaproteobacteria bacterium]|nr:metallophosphoesterase [Deltaproteobacteria bacterium]